MRVLGELEPKEVFQYFEDISSIPRGSYNTKAVCEYCEAFAIEHKLRYRTDDYHNIIIWKPATIGCEQAPTLMLQGHLDMVCEKNSAIMHDFLRDPLKLVVEDDMLYAEGTTLGADDGIAVAMCLAILADNLIQHPALEVVFTSEEEVGMEGALGLNTHDLQARYLLNLDSEDEGELTAGCAGGATFIARRENEYEIINGYVFEVSITGLQGGHSGVDIVHERANANKLLARLLQLFRVQWKYQLVSLQGGLKNNAIPREASAKFVVLKNQEDKNASCEKILESLEQLKLRIQEDIYREYIVTEIEKNIEVQILHCAQSDEVHAYSQAATKSIIDFMYIVPNGIQTMNHQIDQLVETSLNLGTICSVDNVTYMEISVRSSIESRRELLLSELQVLADRCNMEVKIEARYPGWEYQNHSILRDRMINIYERMYGEKPCVAAIHAGLECGILASKMPDLDIISTGPNIYDIHTPKERISIASVARTYDYVIEILKEFAIMKK